MSSPPRILIDLYKIRDLYSGLGHFSLQFAHALLAQEDIGFRPTFLIPRGTAHLLPAQANFLEAHWSRRYVPALNPRFDLWHSLHQFPSFAPTQGQRWLLTVHDLNFLVEKEGAKRKRYLNRLQRQVDRADALSTVSQFARTQIEEYLRTEGQTVEVIYNGIEEAVEPQRPDSIPDRPFLFSIGAFHAKKNFAALLPMLEHAAYDLVIAGNLDMDYGREVRRAITRHGLEDRVHLPGTVSEAEKQWYYAHCEAFVFPSFAEGFGMPVIEALRWGRPVFINPVTALPEVGGEVAFHFEKMEARSMASVLQSGIESAASHAEHYAARARAQAEQFSWERCIRSYIELYHRVLQP